MCLHDLIPTVSKPTRVTRNAATAIDHIITNSAINAGFKTGIIKTDISDHFPIFFIFKCVVDTTEARKAFIYNRNYSGNSVETFNSLATIMVVNDRMKHHVIERQFTGFL